LATLVWPENEPRIYQTLSKTNPLIFVSNQVRTNHVLKPCLAASTYDSSHANSKFPDSDAQKSDGDFVRLAHGLAAAEKPIAVLL
jgi:hypothetical protein